MYYDNHVSAVKVANNTVIVVFFNTVPSPVSSVYLAKSKRPTKKKWSGELIKFDSVK